MKRFVASICLALMLGAGAGGAAAQTTVDEAREMGKAMGKAMRADDTLMPSEAKVADVPGYAGNDLPQGAYFEDPDAMAAQGATTAASDDTFGTVTDRDHTRPTFANSEILDTTARATEIEKDPNAYVEGEAISGTTGACKPLPPSSTPTGYYEATCNRGVQVTETPQSCTGRIVPVVTNTERFFYYATPDAKAMNGFAAASMMNAKVAAGVCRIEPKVIEMCDALIEMGIVGDPVRWRRFCVSEASRRGPAQLYSCSSEIPSAEIPYHNNDGPGGTYVRKEGVVTVTTRRDEGTCPALAADNTCTAQGSMVCTEGPETRIISGVPVTQSCWAWRNDFVCRREAPASDCSALDANRSCRFVRTDCLDDPASGPCKVEQRVYRCPLPPGPKTDDKQYVCGDDVYCLNGDCETIEREASTEFKDALVALHSIGDAGKQFDPNNLTVFSGEYDTCHKKLFGLANCCSGKGVPMLTPALCSAAEKKLDEKDDKGLCHKVGTFCSDSVLGVCVTSKDAYCCFGSKLSRILQEQGRAQIGKPWAKPKVETCKGFTIEEFQRLDLSRMDFTEVYAEFMDAAKLPDEVSTMTDIQTKIQDYYDLHGQ